MDNYEFTPYKINKLFKEVSDTKNKLDTFEVFEKDRITLNYLEKKSQYIIEEDYAFHLNSNVKFFEIYLNKFPEDLIPFIQMIAIYTIDDVYSNYVYSLDPIINNFTPEDIYTIPIFYDYKMFAIYENNSNETNEKIYYLKGRVDAQLTKWKSGFIPEIIYLPLHAKIYLYVDNVRKYETIRTNKT
jgi:hypothetical protein